MQVLTENLYFKSLDNNAGAIQQLLDTAADEEVKEVFLAYSFLSATGEEMSAEQLDDAIELWLRENFDCDTNFDVAGAADKAVELGLARLQEGQYRAVDGEEALAGLNALLEKLVFPA